MRIYKKVDSVDTILKEEYYLRDATGRELAVIDNNYNINWYIYGKERVASMHHEMPVGLEKLFITSEIPDGTHYAAESIQTDGSVQSDATLEAGDRVSMLPGFTAPTDADFKADIKKPDGIPNFIYYLYDHLGNTRVTYSVKVKASNQIDYTVQSATDYYPYGKALRSYGKERYQSTYHERDLESGFDYRGARFYDSDVARFNSLDPLAAEFASWSPYNYVMGNPLSLVDSDGKQPDPPDWLERAGNAISNTAGKVTAYASGVFNSLASNAIGSPPNTRLDPTSFGEHADFAAYGQTAGDVLSVGVGGTGVVAGFIVGTGGTVVTLGGATIPASAAGLAIGAPSATMFGAGMRNLMSKDQTGSYTNNHVSGKRYHGKGGKKRADKSADEKAEQYNDPLESQDWTPAKNDREAFKDEARRLIKDGNNKSPDNYNKRKSPGEKYLKEDGDDL